MSVTAACTAGLLAACLLVAAPAAANGEPVDAQAQQRADTNAGPVDAPAQLRVDTNEAKETARALFRRGNENVRQKAYAAALEDYRAAYRLWPSPKILLNTGTVLQLVGRAAEAADAYARYLEDPDADPDRIPEVEAVVEKLDVEVVRLEIHVADQPADISVDDEPAGVAAPNLTCRVDPGVHTVAATRDAMVATARVVASGGDVRRVELAFSALAVATGHDQLGCARSAAPPMSTVVVAGLSILAAGAGAYFGARLRDDNVDYEEARALATRANIAYGIAAVGTGAAGGLWLFSAHREQDCGGGASRPTLNGR